MENRREMGSFTHLFMFGAGLAAVALSACSGDGGDGPSNDGGDGDGDSSNGDGDGDSSNGDGDGDGDSGFENVECSDTEMPCNGECLAPGESANGCSALLDEAGYLQTILLDDTHIFLGVDGDGSDLDRIVVYDKSTLTLAYEIEGLDDFDLGYMAINDTHLAFLQWPPFTTDPIPFTIAPKGSATTTALDDLEEIDGLHGVDGGWLLVGSSFNTDDRVSFLPTEGGEATGIGSGPGAFNSNGLQVKNDAYYYATGGGPDPEVIWQQPLAGGERVQLVSVQTVDAFHVDDSYVYLIEGAYTSDPSHLARVPLAGGAIEAIGEDTHRFENRLFGYGSWLYTTEVTENDDGPDAHYIVGHPKEGGEDQIVALSSHRFVDLVIDDTGIYVEQFSVSGRFQLLRLDLLPE